MGASQSSDPNKALRVSLKSFVNNVRKNKMTESEFLEASPIANYMNSMTRSAKATRTASKVADKIKSSGSSIKQGVDYVAGASADHPEGLKEILKWIKFAIDASVRALGKIAEGASITYIKLANAILKNTGTKIIFGVGFIIVILLVIGYLSRNE